MRCPLGACPRITSLWVCGLLPDSVPGVDTGVPLCRAAEGSPLATRMVHMALRRAPTIQPSLELWCGELAARRSSADVA